MKKSIESRLDRLELAGKPNRRIEVLWVSPKGKERCFLCHEGPPPEGGRCPNCTHLLHNEELPPPPEDNPIRLVVCYEEPAAHGIPAQNLLAGHSPHPLPA